MRLYVIETKPTCANNYLIDRTKFYNIAMCSLEKPKTGVSWLLDVPENKVFVIDGLVWDAIVNNTYYAPSFMQELLINKYPNIIERQKIIQTIYLQDKERSYQYLFKRLGGLNPKVDKLFIEFPFDDSWVIQKY